MPELTENPAIILRRAVEAQGLPGMLRWDESGKALLVSDAPRRGGRIQPIESAKIWEEDGLLRIDLPAEAYQALTKVFFEKKGPWDEAWFEPQSQMLSIISRPSHETRTEPLDIRLIRRTMIACVREESVLRLHMKTLRAADADLLREGAIESSRICAALCAYALWTRWGIGMPAPHRISISHD